MTIAEIMHANGAQLVKLPEGFHFEGNVVSIRRDGAAVILEPAVVAEPVKPAAWPPGFFESIRIDDPAFARPEQGTIPPAPNFD